MRRPRCWTIGDLVIRDRPRNERAHESPCAAVVECDPEPHPPLLPLVRVEHTFAHLGRWRRLSRCFEGSRESARVWLEVAAFGYLLGRLEAARPPERARASHAPSLLKGREQRDEAA